MAYLPAALLNEVLSDNGEDDSATRLSPRSRKRVYTELNSFDSALSSMSNAEPLNSQTGATPKRSRLFRHRKIIVRSKSKENRSITSNTDLLSELKKTNTTMGKLAEKVKKAEKRMRNMEEKVSSSSSSSPSSSKKAVSVPSGIRREIRRIYKMLLEEDPENFSGWKIEPGITYKDRPNQIVLKKLIKEVQSLNPAYLTEHIKDAGYRFYRTNCETESIKRRGKDREKNRQKRRHERLARKLQERRSALEKATFAEDSDVNRQQWESILSLELMSTDKSDCADDGITEILVTHQLPWLSDTVNNFKKLLDKESLKGKSPQAIRQMKARIEGSPSTRQQPEPGVYPTWVFN